MGKLVKDKNILVTGAGGFIGHYLVKYLKQKGFWVRGVDIKYPEYEETVADEFILLDLRRWENCLKAVKGVEEVYHLAANMGGIGFIESHKAEIVHDNVLINIHMLEAARLNNVDKFFFTSSACVYPGYKQNSPDIAPLKEEDAYPADAEDGYGWEKLYTERACRHYMEDYSLKTYSVRFHNIYGPLGTYDGGREKSPAAICRKIALAKPVDEIEVWGDGCFPAGEQIVGNPHLKSIEDFKVGDAVLGIEGFQKVTNTFNRQYIGNLFTIKPEGMLPFRVTTEHPLLIYRLETSCRAAGAHWCKPGCRRCYHSRCKHKIKYWKGWIKTSEILEDRDYLCLPKIKTEIAGKIDLRSYVLQGHGDGRPQEQSSLPIIKINEDWAWLFGLYLAEGYSYDEKVTWCLGTQENNFRKELHDRLAEVGLRWWEDNKKSAPWSRETHIANAPLSRWLKENFGSSARDKRIPSVFFSLPKKEIKAFINGYFKGDGTSKSIYSSKRWKATSASKNVLMGIQILLAKVGNFGNIMWTEDWGKRNVCCGTISYAERPKNVHWFQDKDYIFIPIRSIKKAYLKGKVYNLETQDHTYCLPIVVHNCQTRSYCFIDDCVEGIYRLMQSDYHQPLNLGTDRMVTIDQLVDIVAKIAGKKITKRYDLTKPQGVRGRNSDNTKLRQVLKWEPRISLEEGLKKTYDWIFSQIENQLKK